MNALQGNLSDNIWFAIYQKFTAEDILQLKYLSIQFFVEFETCWFCDVLPIKECFIGNTGKYHMIEGCGYSIKYLLMHLECQGIIQNTYDFIVL